LAGVATKGTHLSGAARAARCLKQCIPNISPDSLRCSATKVSFIERDYDVLEFFNWLLDVVDRKVVTEIEIEGEDSIPTL